MLFVDDHEILHQAFIVSDQNFIAEVRHPTTVKTLASLLACYYSFHRKYPLAYKTSLEFISHCIFNANMTNINAQKYLRRLRNFENDI